MNIHIGATLPPKIPHNFVLSSSRQLRESTGQLQSSQVLNEAERDLLQGNNGADLKQSQHREGEHEKNVSEEHDSDEAGETTELVNNVVEEVSNTATFSMEDSAKITNVGKLLPIAIVTHQAAIPCSAKPVERPRSSKQLEPLSTPVTYPRHSLDSKAMLPRLPSNYEANVNVASYHPHQNQHYMKPPTGPPPSMPDIVVSNPALLPHNLAINRRFHYKPINPAYLVASNSDSITINPQHMKYLQEAEFENVVRIPATYVAAYNVVASVNGRALAVPLQNSLEERLPAIVKPVKNIWQGQTTNSVYGSGLLPPMRSSPRDNTAQPTYQSSIGSQHQPGNLHCSNSNNAANLLHLTTPEYTENYLSPTAPEAFDSEEIAKQWIALLTSSSPMGRRGWNQVGRGNTFAVRDLFVVGSN
ncbi:hypothetical protein HDV05_005327 [Chytridiales sp. JEL 0842]|nr:hypothetical protein HDV05_005327 [Chytridiales sp. JEL 0842]